MTQQQVALFFGNFGLSSDREAKPLSLERYCLIVTAGARWFGPLFGQMVADCFMPTGMAVEPGYEDSLDTYIFEYPPAEELQGFLDFLQDCTAHSKGSDPTHSRASRRKF